LVIWLAVCPAGGKRHEKHEVNLNVLAIQWREVAQPVIIHSDGETLWRDAVGRSKAEMAENGAVERVLPRRGGGHTHEGHGEKQAKQRIVIYIDPEDYEELVRIAAEQERRIPWLVRGLVRESLSRKRQSPSTTKSPSI
jgi:hypothetical protein